MKIVFVSNYLNHHQTPFCEDLLKLCDDFYFIATDRNAIQGFQLLQNADYCINYTNETCNLVEGLLVSADVVIFGATPKHLISLRMKTNKLTFFYSERFYKKGTWRRISPRSFVNIYQKVLKYRRKNLYILCASAYLPYDLSLLFFPIHKCYKWGYFPRTKLFDIDDVINKKNKQTIELLWVGRLLDWKHPDDAVSLAKVLKDKNYKFHLSIVGDGPLHESLRNMISEQGLCRYVDLVGPKSAEEVRTLMIESNVFLLTSDQMEGWGAVLNEAMNSGCAVIASNKVGSAPYLIENNVNGLIYNQNDFSSLVEKASMLLSNKEMISAIGRKAYNTITSLWSHSIAAERIVHVSEELLNNKSFYYENGPCSRTMIIKDPK